MKYVLLLVIISLSACAPSNRNYPVPGEEVPLTPIGQIDDTGVVVKGRGIVTVESENISPVTAFFNRLMSAAYAATGTSTVTYNNVGVTTFTLNETGFTPGSFTGDVLSLGNIVLSGLDDNTLKVCGTGSTKCVTAIIRIYTTGTTAGFVNTANSYGVPVFAGALNPTSQVGLNAAGSVQMQLYTIPANTYRIKTAVFPSPTYAVTSDFSNAGSGSFSSTFVVEYALQ